jgi:outer membrane lipoprotein LolB
MSFRVARALAAGAAALLCAGCAMLMPNVPVAEPFDILGRVLASSEGRAFSANFRWRHADVDNEIWLMSPVGQTLAYIAADAGGATLTTADQQEYRALSVEGLTRQALGWPLPLAQLQHWIRGGTVPDSATAVVTRDTRGRLSLLEQEGWRIRFTYPETGDGMLPRQLELTQGGQRIRMVVDEWRAQEGGP